MYQAIYHATEYRQLYQNSNHNIIRILIFKKKEYGILYMPKRGSNGHMYIY